MSIDVGKYQNAAALKSPSNSRVPWWQRDIKLPGQGWNDRKKERLYSELLTLLQSGIDLRSALELLAEEQQKPAEAAFYQQLCDNVIDGQSLSDALEESGAFGPYEYYSVKIGEESGRLLEILHELQSFYARKIKLKRQFVSVLTYPLFVFGVSIGVIWFMLTYIVPMFSDVFKRFDQELPELTQFVISLSEQMGYWLPWIGGAILLVAVILVGQRNTPWFRKNSARFAQRVPFFGGIIRRVYLARFCQSMHLLISAKTPLVDTLGLVARMIRFYPLEVASSSIQNDLEQGISLHESMRKFKVFDARMVALLKVAEEVNQLDTMFEKLAQQYSEEVEHKTGIMGGVIEPIMIIFIALFVGAILVAMYLPLFQLSTTIG